MHYFRRGSLVALVSIILVALGCYGFHRYSKQQEWKSRKHFCSSLTFSYGQDKEFTIHPISTDSAFIVVIPAYWEPSAIQANYNSRHSNCAIIDGQRIQSQWEEFSISFNKPLEISLKGLGWNCIFPNKIIFYQSNLNSIFINTSSGTIDAIDNSKDKSYKEDGRILVVSDSGRVDYCGNLDNIHGRGNMTWNLQKKPYSIKLEKSTELLGLKKAKKYNLLANMCDETSLRNWIMLNTAQELGCPNAIRSAFVSLYCNGRYRGLYQITNKIEVSTAGVDIFNLEEATKKANKDKLKHCEKFSINRNDTTGFQKGIIASQNPEDISGGYLLEANFKLHRYSNEISGFIPEYGYPIVIKAPEYATQEQVEYITGYFNEMMEAIRSVDGFNPKTHKYYTDYIDVDSYIYYYLCSECFYNLDAVFASFYMYKDRGGKMFCGPLWDFDLSLNTKVYFDKANGHDSFFVREAREKDESLMIFGQLYKHADYRHRLIEIFNNRFLPIIQQYTHSSLDSIHNKISEDLAINNKIWEKEYQRLYGIFQNGRIWNKRANSEYEEILSLGDYWNIKNYLSQRILFMKDIWRTIDSEKSYTSVYFDYGREEQFQHTPTRVVYPYNQDTFILPRFLLEDEQIMLDQITDAEGALITDNQQSNYYKLQYRAKATE